MLATKSFDDTNCISLGGWPLYSKASSKRILILPAFLSVLFQSIPPIDQNGELLGYNISWDCGTEKRNPDTYSATLKTRGCTVTLVTVRGYTSAGKGPPAVYYIDDTDQG